MKSQLQIITIIIVNYKSWKVLRSCLKSIEKITSTIFEFEVIVVDNKSDDGNFEGFKKEFLNVEFLENSGNNGFANACNYGVKKSKGTYLLFLNPDTLLNHKAITKMFNFYVKHDCGIVSCLQNNNIKYEKSKRYFPDFNSLFGLLRAFNKNKLEKNIKEQNNTIYPDWVSGAVVFISRYWLTKVEFWNEDYWMYFEDVDLSKKVSDKGGDIVLLKDCEIFHNHGGSSRVNVSTSVITKGEVIKSKHIYLSNHFNGLKLFVMQFLLVFFTLLGKIIFGLLCLFLIFLPKARIYFLLMITILNYYISALINQTWLSKRSMNYK